ncbi:MAG: hypothetical protein WC282_00335 [Bacilli bacterium]|jgi:hypothetical protein
MSEIKGQLLGVLLVVMIFAGISGALMFAFENATQEVADKIEAPISATSAQSVIAIDYQGL